MNPSLKHHWVAILITTLVTFVSSVALTVVQPMEYRSSFTVLAIDNDPNLDGYAAAKSAERLSQSLGRTISTASFADQVYAQLKDRVELKDNPLVSSDAQTRRDAWKKEVSAQAFPDVGQVKVSVYQRDRSQATTIANTVSISVTAYGGEYLGGGKDVLLKIVDAPLVSKIPVRPNVFANLAVGLILGFAGSIAFFLLFAAPKVPAMPMFLAPMNAGMLSNMTAPVAQPMPVTMAEAMTRQAQSVSTPAPTPAPEEMKMHQPSARPAQVASAKHEGPANLPIWDEIVMP